MCSLEFVPEDGSPPLTCDRKGIHVLHENYTTGVKFKPVSDEVAEVRTPLK